MKQEILKFIQEKNLSPFNNLKTQIKNANSMHKTIDSKKIYNKTLQKISHNFIFPDTSNILQFFEFTNSKEEVNKRQIFFSKLKDITLDNSFLNEITFPKPTWKPPYDITVVTEDTNTFDTLKKMNCPVQLLISEIDLAILESKDIIQIIDCPEYGRALESLPQAVFLKNISQVYLERYLEQFSGWINNIDLLSQKKIISSLKEIIDEISPLNDLAKNNDIETLDPDEIEKKIDTANKLIEDKLKQLTLSGESLVDILSKGILPQEIKNLIENILQTENIPRQIIEIGIPLKVDEQELHKLIDEQSKNEFSNLAEKITKYSEQLKDIPEKLNNLSNSVLYFDFIAGISKFIKQENFFPEISEKLKIKNSNNIFLENPHPISFNLEEFNASILTGANSGGKTTLIEHVIQLISLTQLGLPTSGNNKIPLFEEIYYFAKNKGSNLKGAFETLLTQMSKIKPGNKTLILADEIEAVTEPGVAGNIIAATTKYYIEKNCYLIIATHLGHEIQKILPEKTRIDGIEATGLTESFELIVNHNPVLNKLAHSTPELIVEKMAKKEQKDYFKFLNNFLKNLTNI